MSYLILLVFAVLPIPYEKALDEYNKDGKTMVVVIGADWCPGCISLDKKLKAMTRTDFNYVHLDYEDGMAKKIMVGQTIPYTTKYSKVNGEQVKASHVGDFGYVTKKGLFGRLIVVKDELEDFIKP